MSAPATLGAGPTTHADAAAQKLRTDARDPLRLIAQAVREAIAAQSAMYTAHDLDDVMRATAALVLTCDNLANQAEAAHKALRRALEATMQDTGCTSLDLRDCTAFLRAGARFAMIDQPDLIPPRYVTPRAPEIDRPAIRRDLLDKIDVPGARLSNGGPSTLSFRPKAKANERPSNPPDPAASRDP